MSETPSSPRTPGRYGARPPGVTLGPLNVASAWNVQGAHVAITVEHAFGVVLDDRPNTVTHGGGVTALWLGPASWLLVTGAAEGAFGDYAAQRDALQAAGGALFDVSASRIAIAVRGARALDVLAAGCPLDLHPDAFVPGRCAQSVLARVSTLFCRAQDGIVLMVPQSFGRDVWHGLCGAALEFGYEIEAERAWRAPYGA